jgi:hypothetical protein
MAEMSVPPGVLATASMTAASEITVAPPEAATGCPAVIPVVVTVVCAINIAGGERGAAKAAKRIAECKKTLLWVFMAVLAFCSNIDCGGPQ